MLLSEITGSDLLDFADYLQTSQWVAKKAIPGFEKLGADLSKRGFQLYTDSNVRFNKDEGHSAGWAVAFPYSRAFNNGVSMMWSGWSEELGQLIVGRKHFTLKQIEEIGLDACLQQVKDAAGGIHESIGSAPVTEGLGADVLAFSEYLETKLRKELAVERMCHRIATMLFKNGYIWQTENLEGEDPHFKNGEKRITLTGHKYSRSMTFWTADGELHKRWALGYVDRLGMDKIDGIFARPNRST